MYEYHCNIVRVVDGDTLVVDVDLGFKVWLHGVSMRLSDVSAPELNTSDGLRWRDWWSSAVGEHGNPFVVRVTKDAKQTLSRWLGSIYLRDGHSTADLLDPKREHRHKRTG